MARAGGGAPRELSLEEVLKCYEQPLNEEQAWALCFQGCRAAAAAPAAPPRTADILLRADGTVGLPAPPPGERGKKGGSPGTGRGCCGEWGEDRAPLEPGGGNGSGEREPAAGGWEGVGRGMAPLRDPVGSVGGRGLEGIHGWGAGNR